MSTLNWLRICCRKKIQVEILIDFRRHSEKYLSNSKLYYMAFGHHDVKDGIKIRSFFPFGRRESTHHEHARWNAFHRGHCNHCPRSHRYGCVFLDCLYCVKWYLQDAMSQNAKKQRWQCRSKSDPNSSTFDEAQGGKYPMIHRNHLCISIYMPQYLGTRTSKILIIMVFYP